MNSAFQPITLDEMRAVKLMNRTDTKFVTNNTMLQQLLVMLQDEYLAQVSGDKMMADYHTLYFDTPDNLMYLAHHNGRKSRQKLRIRSYVSSEEHFLEVKTKNNHGKTKKKRVAVNCVAGSGEDIGERLIEGCDMNAYADFLGERLWLPASEIQPKIENRFNRITLVNKQMTERLTIDYDLRFHNFENDKRLSLDNIVIIELKRDSLQASPVLPRLNELRIFPMGFSKYCIGMALTDPMLKQNRFKQRLHTIEKILTK